MSIGILYQSIDVQLPLTTHHKTLLNCPRPSTPLYDLLENRYQERWLADRRETERQEREKIISRRGKVYETRASLLRRHSEPVDPPPYWKMKRWSKVNRCNYYWVNRENLKVVGWWEFSCRILVSVVFSKLYQ